MRLLIALMMALAMIVAGCNSSEEQSEVVRVENPPAAEEAAEANKEPAEPEVAAAPGQKQPAATKGKDGFVQTSSGLKYKDIKPGTGAAVKANDLVTVHYKGWLDDGTVFDTSRKPGREPFSFRVDNDAVIPGWHEGLKGMKKGGVRELEIPAKLGYGPEGSGPIPPNATLHFNIELLDISSA